MDDKLKELGFNTSDKAPILTREIHFKHYIFGVREIILAIISLTLFVLCLIFAGLLGHEKVSQQAVTVPTKSPLVVQPFCVTPGCLKTAAHSLQFMNTSVNPCHDFYQYACGNYPLVRQRSPVPYQYERTVFTDINRANRERLEKVLVQPIGSWSYWETEKKLKQFYRSCMDIDTKDDLKGNPFLDQVVRKMPGGWDVLGTWKEGSWDLNAALKMVQGDFWTFALYKIEVNTYNNEKVIELSDRVLGMDPWYYIGSGSWAVKLRQDYKAYIRRVGSLLQRDAKVKMTSHTKSSKLDTFVNDVFRVENKLAAYSYTWPKQTQQTRLGRLSSEYRSEIEWEDQLKYILPNARLHTDSRVEVKNVRYFQKMSDMIDDTLPKSTRKRTLNNYFMWRMAHFYTKDLSCEYTHANRKHGERHYGYGNVKPLDKYCLDLTGQYMSDALSSLFVHHHFNEQSKQEVTAISSTIKHTLKEQIDTTPWMDSKTKESAKKKLKLLKFKLGYADWMMDPNHLDEMYHSLNVSHSTSLAKVLSANLYERSKLTDEFLSIHGYTRTQQTFRTYDADMKVSWPHNEVIAPSGILQPPIYSPDSPHSVKYGALGSLLGRYLHDFVHSFDKYNQDSPYYWWTNASRIDYEKHIQCVNNSYSDVTKDFPIPGGENTTVRLSQKFLPIASAYDSGIRLALDGYTKWASKPDNTEKKLPGLHLSNQQMFFLAHAQSMCYNRVTWRSYFMAKYPEEVDTYYTSHIQGPGEDIQVNTAFKQLKEFSDVWGCGVGDDMYSEHRCHYH